MAGQPGYAPYEYHQQRHLGPPGSAEAQPVFDRNRRAASLGRRKTQLEPSVNLDVMSPVLEAEVEAVAAHAVHGRRSPHAVDARRLLFGDAANRLTASLDAEVRDER